MMRHGAAGDELSRSYARRRLPLIAGRAQARWNRARALIVLIGAAAAGLFGLSFTQPWWTFKLYAPQYPRGLDLVISLTGMGGDVSEIDILNHYIGMAHLAEAAPVERRLAGWGVAAIAVFTLVAVTAAGKRLNKLVAIPAILFPLVFLADSFSWLYAFGHHLDPKAPIRLGAFTPQMFGNGKIGQFATFAQPALGFWLAVAGAALAVIAVVVRARVCAGCSRTESCKLACPRLMVLPDEERTMVRREEGSSA